MKSSKNYKPFKDWLYEEVQDAFGLTRLFDYPLFDFFKTLHLEKNYERYKELERLRKLSLQYIESWNEDEYKFMFISPFINCLELVSPHYKVFTQRLLSVRYENDTKKSEGLVEFMVAKGIQNPKKPYFFLHEYKPEKRRDNDPLGQLLIAMVAAQKINQDNKIIYGIYLNGRNWFLVALEKNHYAVSLAYDVSSEAIFDLFAILLYLKQEMENFYREI